MNEKLPKSVPLVPSFQIAIDIEKFYALGSLALSRFISSISQEEWLLSKFTFQYFSKSLELTLYYTKNL